MRKRNSRGVTLLEFLVVVLIIFLPLTAMWGTNVVKLCNLDFEAPYKAEVLRIIGIPAAPIGMILAWVTFEEEEEEYD